MTRDLRRKLDDALEKAIERRESSGRPFTGRDLINDLSEVMNAPEFQKVFVVDRLAELIEEERLQTGAIPSTARIKDLLKREAERVKHGRAELDKELDQVFTRALADQEIN